VLHEFSPIQGVVEDATDIILNLKQIPLKMHVDYTKTLYLRVEKPGIVRAKDIEGTPTWKSSSRKPTSPPSRTVESSTWSCA
jgi:DNA-directed RNA polymerase alpha subunit